MMRLWLRPLGSTALTLVFGQYSRRSAEAIKALGVPSTLGQGRQWWWLELVVCTHLALGTGYKCQLSGEGQSQTHVAVRARAGSGGWSQRGAHWQQPGLLVYFVSVAW